MHLCACPLNPVGFKTQLFAQRTIDEKRQVNFYLAHFKIPYINLKLQRLFYQKYIHFVKFKHAVLYLGCCKKKLNRI